VGHAYYAIEVRLNASRARVPQSQPPERQPCYVTRLLLFSRLECCSEFRPCRPVQRPRSPKPIRLRRGKPRCSRPAGVIITIITRWSRHRRSRFRLVREPKSPLGARQAAILGSRPNGGIPRRGATADQLSFSAPPLEPSRLRRCDCRYMARSTLRSALGNSAPRSFCK
jgi:hypothetical protein